MLKNGGGSLPQPYIHTGLDQGSRGFTLENRCLSLLCNINNRKGGKSDESAFCTSEIPLPGKLTVMAIPHHFKLLSSIYPIGLIKIAKILLKIMTKTPPQYVNILGRCCLSIFYGRAINVSQTLVGIPEAMLKMQFFLCNVSM